MEGLAPEGSQFDDKQYDKKTQELLTEDFFTSYDEVCESFDNMGATRENLLKGIHACGMFGEAISYVPEPALMLRDKMMSKLSRPRTP